MAEKSFPLKSHQGQCVRSLSRWVPYVELQHQKRSQRHTHAMSSGRHGPCLIRMHIPSLRLGWAHSLSVREALKQSRLFLGSRKNSIYTQGRQAACFLESVWTIFLSLEHLALFLLFRARSLGVKGKQILQNFFSVVCLLSFTTSYLYIFSFSLCSFSLT